MPVQAIALLCLLFVAGCSATHARRVHLAHDHFSHGRLDEAAEILTKELKRPGRRKEVLNLDLASVELARGQPARAENLLREVRDRLDKHAQSNAVESVSVLMTDDAARGYSGTGYEQVMVRVMAALASLMRDGGDAEAYALQAIEKQRHLAEAAGQDAVSEKNGLYQPVAIAPYLRGVMRESTLHDYDDATRAYQLVSQIQPSFRLAEFDIARASGGVHSPPGHGVLYVIALVGRGPRREPKTAEITSDALLVADRIFSAVGKHSLPPTIAPVVVPTVVIPPSNSAAVAIGIQGNWVAQTEMLTDVGQLALATWDAERPQVVGRAVTRRVMKKAAIYAAKEGTGINNPLGELAMDAVGVAWEATERCDTRCWGLLPREIQVARLELPAAQHVVALQALSPYHALGNPSHLHTVSITSGANSYLMVFLPDDRIVGVVSRETQHTASLTDQ